MEAIVPVFDPTLYPEEFTSLIFSFLKYQDIARSRQVCKKWNKTGALLQCSDLRLLKQKFWLNYEEFIQVDGTDLKWNELEQHRSSREKESQFVVWEKRPTSIAICEYTRSDEAEPWYGNVGVWSGKFYYEMTVIRYELDNPFSGDIELGWCTSSSFCKVRLSEEYCTYDPLDAMCFNFDGKMLGRPFGEKCKPGGVVGCGIDADLGKVDYWLNGIYVGTAITELAKAEGKRKIYYPVVDVNSKRASVSVNFSGPFLKLPDGYSPLGDVDEPEKLELRTIILKQHVAAKKLESCTAIEAAVSRCYWMELGVKLFATLFNTEIPATDVFPLIKTFAKELEVDLTNLTPDAARSRLEEIAELKCLEGAQFFLLDFYHKCCRETRKLQQEKNLVSPPIDARLSFILPHIRALQVRLNPLGKDLHSFAGYSTEEEAEITKILEHPISSHVLDRLNLNASELNVVLELGPAIQEILSSERREFYFDYNTLRTLHSSLLCIDPSMATEDNFDMFSLLSCFYFVLQPFEPIPWNMSALQMFNHTLTLVTNLLAKSDPLLGISKLSDSVLFEGIQQTSPKKIESLSPSQKQTVYNNYITPELRPFIDSEEIEQALASMNNILLHEKAMRTEKQKQKEREKRRRGTILGTVLVGGIAALTMALVFTQR